MSGLWIRATTAAAIGASAWILFTGDAEAKKPAPNVSAPDPALERARDTTKMLDTLYKNYVVSITENYVSARASLPAATTSKPVFAAMEKGGFHSVRLIDCTGEPVNEKNVAVDDFEKAAVKKINAGAGSVEEVIEIEGKRYLRTATVVPVVMKQCVVCHPHKKVGEVLGALVYKVPVK